MQPRIREKLDHIDALTELDPVYARMLRRGCVLEKEFDAMISALPMAQRNLAWDFVMLCEEMSSRKLELACTHMEFVSNSLHLQKKTSSAKSKRKITIRRVKRS